MESCEVQVQVLPVPDVLLSECTDTLKPLQWSFCSCVVPSVVRETFWLVEPCCKSVIYTANLIIYFSVCSVLL